MFIIDTDVLSALRRPDRAPAAASWLASANDAELFLSVVTIGEIERGIALQQAKNPAFAADLRRWLDRTLRLFEERILPFLAEDALIWGRLSAALGHSGADLMIAASALSRGATIVTGNVSDYAPTGVPLFDPFLR